MTEMNEQTDPVVLLRLTRHHKSTPKLSRDELEDHYLLHEGEKQRNLAINLKGASIIEERDKAHERR